MGNLIFFRLPFSDSLYIAIIDSEIMEVFRAVINPRTAGVWLVTRPAGGGGGQRILPPRSQTTGPISKFRTPLDSPRRELPEQGIKFDLEVTDDVTGQVKVRIFDFSGLVTWASKISMLKGLTQLSIRFELR